MHRRRTIHILLVDDDEIDIMNVQRAFKRNNITNPLYVARDGVEAIEMLRGDGAEKLPHSRLLVLLDLNLPRMNGLELLQEIRKDKDLRALPVVILTTSDDDQDKIRAYNLNVAGYIVKPVTFTAFADTMATLNTYWTISEMH
ncbi:MAG: response regulator [Oscillochloris sp.]|nr:response regulator [Oscillochloris sp.]